MLRLIIGCAGGEGGKAGARTGGNDSAEQPVMPVRNGARSQARQSVLAVLETLHAACRELVDRIFPDSRVHREVEQGKQEAAGYARMLKFLGVLGSTEVAEASQIGQSDRGLTIAARLTITNLQERVEKSPFTNQR